MTADWARHDDAWRNPAEVVGLMEATNDDVAPLLEAQTRGDFWGALDAADVTLLVSREYEHLLVALSVHAGKPRTTFLRLPHPSGIAVDRRRNVVHVASTRNPNLVHELAPVTAAVERADVSGRVDLEERPLVPLRSTTFPGSLYIHDLALVKGTLHANAVGHNCVVQLGDRGAWRPVWWPASVDRGGRPEARANYLQLNSIAAGTTLERSYFSASTDRIGRRRPGHLDFPVDGRGVIFSGATHEPVVRGLTRPHSARLHGRRLWVLNSGYGELSAVERGAAVTVARLPGWTRGLSFADSVAFVGTSRVIPRFHRYAPGVDQDRSVCGVHVVSAASGETLGSLVWPTGNQVFAVDWVPRSVSAGLPFRLSRSARQLFYTFNASPERTR